MKNRLLNWIYTTESGRDAAGLFTLGMIVLSYSALLFWDDMDWHSLNDALPFSLWCLVWALYHLVNARLSKKYTRDE